MNYLNKVSVGLFFFSKVSKPMVHSRIFHEFLWFVITTDSQCFIIHLSSRYMFQAVYWLPYRCTIGISNSGCLKLNRLFIIFYSTIPSLLPSCIKYILNIYFYYLFIFTFIYRTPDFIIFTSAIAAWRAVIHGVTKSRTRLSDWSDLIAVYFLFTPVIVKRKFSNSHMVNWLIFFGEPVS